MKLKRWLDISPVTKEEFADQVGVHRSQVYRWIAGDTRPRDPERIRKIQDLTDGAVRFDDWLNGEK